MSRASASFVALAALASVTVAAEAQVFQTRFNLYQAVTGGTTGVLTPSKELTAEP